MTFLLGLVPLLPPLCSDPAGAHSVDHTSPRHISLHFAQPTLTCMSWKKRPELTDLITVAHQLLSCSTVACAGPSFVFGCFWYVLGSDSHRTCAWTIASVSPNFVCRSCAGCVHSPDSGDAEGAPAMPCDFNRLSILMILYT
jgi:hypothetical protein